jgi:CRP/FNR family transcriptional regulator
MFTPATLDRPVRLLRADTAPRAAPPALARQPCGGCHVSALCLPGGIGEDDLRPLASLHLTTRRFKAGQAVYAEGDPFRSIYAVRRGTCKTTMSAPDGTEQVAGFHMAGEVMGLEGLAGGLHTTTATALEDSEACLIPYRRLVALSAGTAPGTKDLLTHLMGQDMLRHHSMMVLLALTEAADRLAAFLLNLSQRFAARGY